MKKPAWLLVFILLLIPSISDYGATVPPEIKKVVAFVFILDKDGKPVPQGTGFFIGVKHLQVPDSFFVYLVTAKHVLQTSDKQSWLPTVFIRLNKKEEGADMLRLDLIPEGTRKNVFVHEDPSVDLAVVPAMLDVQKYDFKFIPEDFITTKADYQKLGISEGSEVFFSGLFVPHVGEQRNYPIVRFGRVALVTDEKINLGGVRTELYLMEANAYGGNSGSPVFFYLGADRQPGSIILGPPIIKLAGVISGHFNDIVPVQIAHTENVPVVSPNLGIAGVVPAYKLHEILFSQAMINARASGQTPPRVNK